MIEINGRKICENCFEDLTAQVCPCCGYDSSGNANDPAMLIPGSILRGKYIVGKVIGKGGFGITYLAYDAVWSKKIAIKEYFPYGIALRTESGSPAVSVASEESAEAFKLGAEKFYNEAKLVMKFNGNPGIVSVYEPFRENNTVYYAMEYLRGRTLKEYIRDQGLLSAPQALFVAQSIADALVVAHSASVLHRDISPDNIMLSDSGGIKLIDFGAARQIAAEYSQSFSVILKPGFAPPEQYRKKGNQGPWTDVYSLGAMLYFVLTGDIPEDPTARFDDNDTFKSNDFNIAPELWEIITKATKLNIQSRYADAYEMKRALDNVSFAPEPLIVPDSASEDQTIADGITFDPKTGKNITVAPVHIKTMRPKKSFLRRHLRTIIEAACVLAFVAVIIPLAIKAYTPSAASPERGVSSGAPDDGNISSTVPDRDFETLESIGYDKPFYSEMDDKEKRLYEMLYYCVKRGDESITVPSRQYTVGQVPSIYYRMMYDNPQICDVQDFTYSFVDLNNNKTPEDEEYVMTISPFYIAVDPEKMYDKAHTFLDGLDKSDLTECLRQAHDWLISESKITNRYWTGTCTYSYGAIVDCLADDVGFARAFCYLAQELGVYSFVVDEKFNGEQRAWVRLKLDGKWYNVDVYGDKLAGEEITKVPIGAGEDKFHTYFLTGDEFIFSNGYESAKAEGALWTGDDGTPSPNENLYFRQNGQTLYIGGSDNAYNAIIEDIAAHYKDGAETSSYCIAPSLVDELYDKMESSFISDLKEKYDITVSRMSVEYLPEKLTVTLTK